MAAENAVARIAPAGKYLSFMLGEQEYGLEILKVQEINGLVGVVSVPQAPDHVRGMINLRGREIPALDLRRRLRLPAVADTEKTCIVVAQVGHDDSQLTVGVVVDEISEVINLAEGQIAPPTGGRSSMYVGGIGKLDSRDVVLLDIDRVLDDDALREMARAQYPRASEDCYNAPSAQCEVEP